MTVNNWTLIQGTAHALPLADASIDVIIADPPYENGGSRRKPRSKVGLTFASVGYREFEDREWLGEAFRVLKPDGHLYLVIPVREVAPYLALRPNVINIIAWYSPNALSMAARWARGMGGRAFVWRPVLHYAGPDAKPFDWNEISGGFVQGNYVEASLVQKGMREALPWPNQLPQKLTDHLLAPHAPGSVVLDLFSGTGTAGASAARFGLACVSIDIAPRALKLGRRRAPTMPIQWTADAMPELVGAAL